jgi:hypothetical protein
MIKGNLYYNFHVLCRLYHPMRYMGVIDIVRLGLHTRMVLGRYCATFDRQDENSTHWTEYHYYDN